uniref:Uncharacterized protein n=1 Tax=Sparus aurata TaxID=8175 RepID=A0A671Z516_SPAAU
MKSTTHKIKQTYTFHFGLLTTDYLVSSPNVERKTRSLTVDEVKSSRERTPEYCTNSNSGRCCGGICLSLSASVLFLGLYH